MAKNHDPKDDKIAELELSLEEANVTIRTAEARVGEVDALLGELEKQKGLVSEQTKVIAGLKEELAAERRKLVAGERATISGLPQSAGQLATAVILTDVRGGTLYTQSGDVLASGTDEEIEALRKKIGTSATVRHVQKTTVEEQRRAGRLRL